MNGLGKITFRAAFDGEPADACEELFEFGGWSFDHVRIITEYRKLVNGELFFPEKRLRTLN